MHIHVSPDHRPFTVTKCKMQVRVSALHRFTPGMVHDYQYRLTTMSVWIAVCIQTHIQKKQTGIHNVLHIMYMNTYKYIHVGITH